MLKGYKGYLIPLQSELCLVRIKEVRANVTKKRACHKTPPLALLHTIYLSTGLHLKNVGSYKDIPPLTSKIVPLQYAASSEARNR